MSVALTDIDEFVLKEVVAIFDDPRSSSWREEEEEEETSSSCCSSVDGTAKWIFVVVVFVEVAFFVFELKVVVLIFEDGSYSAEVALVEVAIVVGCCSSCNL